MKLSIGMMVKNEAKHLRECLESLEPVRDAIDAELVIIDTGSDDGTVEIAKEFTNKVYFHKWNDNFSEMRNKVIEYCKGEWLFVIDGDEVIEDSYNLIRFLLAEEQKSYNTGLVTQESFTSDDKIHSSSLLQPRLFRNDGEFHYKGAVHNQPIFKHPIIDLELTLLHYGYNSNDPELMERKFKRTAGILKQELEKNPENVYYWYQLAKSYSMHKDMDESLETIQIAYDLMREQKREESFFYVYSHYADMLLKKGQFKKMLKICEEALGVKDGYLDFYYFKSLGLSALGRDKEAIDNFNIYLSLKDNYRYTPSRKDMSFIDSSLSLEEVAYSELAKLHYREENYHEAIKYSLLVKEEKYIKSIFQYLIKSYFELNKYDKIKEYYLNSVLDKKDLEKEFLNALEDSKIQLKESNNKEIIQLFANMNSEYGLLNQVKLLLINNNLDYNKEIINKIKKMDFNELPYYYGDLVYYLIKIDCKSSDILSNIKISIFSNWLAYLAEVYDDVSDDLLLYLTSNSDVENDGVNKSIAKFLLIKDKISLDDYRKVFSKYIEIGIRYLKEVYNQKIINNKELYKIDNLEDEFLLIMKGALEIKGKDDILYIRYLKQALNKYSIMKKGIQLLLNDFQQKTEEENDELEEYKIKSKHNIQTLINNGNLEEAKLLLDEYSNIIENDIDVYSMEAVIAIMKGRLNEANRVLEKGLSLDSNNFDLLYNLGYIYEQLEEYQKAFNIYIEAKSIAISDEEKQDVNQAVERLKSFTHEIDIENKKRLVFFIKKGLDNFIDDIIEGLSKEYITKKVIVENTNQIDEGMEWADICWFEWCDELVIYGSKTELAKKKRIICRLHSYEAFTNYPQQVKWSNVDKIIFVAEHIQRYVLDTVKILKREKTVVIPNGINLNKHKFKGRKKGYNIASVGLINFKKGPMLLLHAFKAIFDKDKRYKLYIAGRFEQPRYLLYFKQMIKEMGLQDNVVFEGWQDDIDEWLEDKNYIISTSVLESQHLSIMEAMAKGIKPLIHNFVGAKNIYPREYIWNTVEELSDMVTSNNYNTKKYRNFIENNYSLDEKLQKIKNLIKIIIEDEESKNQFDYNSYWNNRLNQKFDIEGVGYIGLGKIYNQYMYKIRTEILDYSISKLFDLLKGKDILELGPGIGFYTNYFYQKNISEYRGIDIAKKSVVELTKKYSEFDFVEGDISDFSLYDKKYDLVFAADVLLHLTDEHKYISTISNISNSLKDNGLAILFDPISMIGTRSKSEHVIIRDINYLKEILNEQGLELVSILPTAFFMNNPFDAQLLEDKESLVRNLFSYIQKVFSSNEISKNCKEQLASWLSNLEKQCLINNGFGLSQKALVIANKDNNINSSNLSIEEVWNIKDIKVKKERLKEVLLNNKEVKKYGLLSNFEELINPIIKINE
ncbi:glycosyltransferase involved in cell wall biosynthesis [Orenia metallireducens]|uniref:Glycosyltransferase involved in cell wall bisynthesis n=1 Tax=Orenia metallireducens TaxID=1413210 RepID=A0A285GE61_9FIRM|nr:glycosyltransferase [Orenia metallireducens]PRX32585.1 glycosyltransferase involved in cell wall biosynthesis [Orenia metallireducens]SNY20766.1 Glycosyltransferase involved in cell wall bisynthesis [Orenia metallireducens]